MKKKSKRVGTLLLALAMITVLFGGCSKDNEKMVEQPKVQADSTASGEEVKKAPEDKYAPIEGKEYEITYLTVTSAPVGPDSFMVKKYNEMFNVKLVPIFIESSKWDDILNIKLASGEVPDVLPARSPERLMRYVKQDLLCEVPIGTLNKYSPNLVKTINNDVPDSWTICSVDGKNYGFPYISGGYKFRGPIAWRDDWLKNVGIDKIPDTIQEWEDALRKFRNDDPDQNGKKDTYGCSNSIFAPVFGAFGVMVTEWYDSFWLVKDGKIVFSGVEPGAKEALKVLSKWYKEELMDPEFITGENKGGYWAVSTDFSNGRIGVSARGGDPYHWQKKGVGMNSGPNEEELKKINPNATYTFGLPPLGPDGKSRGMSQNSVATGLIYAFSRDVEPDKLGKILQMFEWPASSPDNWLYNMMGIEGEHHKKVEADGYTTYEYIEKYKDGAKRHDEVALGSFFVELDFKNMSMLKKAFYETCQKLELDKYGVENEYCKLAMPSYGKYITDLNKMLTEAYVSIITGDKPIEYFDEFVSNWKKSGGDTLLNEANECYQSQTKK